MNKELNILLVEDQERDAQSIQEELNKTKSLLEKWEILPDMEFSDIKIEWVHGSDLLDKRGRKYHHFNKDDLPKIHKKVTETQKKNPHTGILMDVILTKDEQERANINDFSQIEFSREIMDYYESKSQIKCGIYIITALRNFGTLAWSIYGRENMERRYIPKDLIVAYPSRKAIAAALYWLYHGKMIPEEISNKIERRELEEL